MRISSNGRKSLSEAQTIVETGVSDPAAIWGGVFLVYILVGVFALSEASDVTPPKNTLPGSSKMEQWKRQDAKGQNWLKLWCVGLAALLVAWLLFR